jgi:hypothetical protein
MTPVPPINNIFKGMLLLPVCSDECCSPENLLTYSGLFFNFSHLENNKIYEKRKKKKE